MAIGKLEFSYFIGWEVVHIKKLSNEEKQGIILAVILSILTTLATNAVLDWLVPKL